MERIYCCIDLKSFFASVECVDRGLDPFKTNLVVADSTRGSGTVCLAITPAMKSLGIKNRCRVFEIPKNLNYIMAKPRMKLYMEKSSEIYSIYLKYISPDDILVYSIDECFIDLTDYVKLYNKTAVEIADMLRSKVQTQTGICATVGVGTNMFLAKIALDITAKHASDYMGYLDQAKFKETIWHHKPITDIWNIGKGIAKRLEKYNITDLYGVAHYDEEKLYKEFGINAELLIDHANGIEPCTIKDVKGYRAKNNSLSNGQVLFCDYSYNDAMTIVKEMVEGLVYELVEKNLVSDSVSLSVGYADREIGIAGGSVKLIERTNSYKKIMEAFEGLYKKHVDRTQYIRRINVGLNNVIQEEYTTIDMFTDIEQDRKENMLNKTIIDIKRKYGKNSVLKGISYTEKATARARNKMIGGHNGGEN